MKEYTVIRIECKKDLKAFDIYSLIKENLNFNHTFFEFYNLFRLFINEEHNGPYSSIPKKQQQRYLKLNLDKYAYTRPINNNQNKNDCYIISNLNKTWEWNHPTSSESMTIDEFEDLLVFTDDLRQFDVITCLLGIDEIEWDKNKVNRGTYGYEKAKSSFDLGENYLSNSVIIGRTGQSKRYTVYLSCEKQFRDLEIIRNMIDFLGKIKSEQTYFAPENENERKEWEIIYKEYEEKFHKLCDELTRLCNELPNDIRDEKGCWRFEDKIDVKKLVKKYLCNNGWALAKNRPQNIGINIRKAKDEGDIYLTLDSLHKGHYLQILFSYEGPRFYFSKNIHYSRTITSEEDVIRYIQNIEFLRDYIYNAF